MQFVLDRLQQIGPFFLVDVELAVARNSKMPVIQNLCAGKQVRKEMPDQTVQKDIFVGSLPRGKLDQPRQNTRHLHDRQMPKRLARKRHLQANDHVQRLVQQLRKGVRGIDRQRCQHRTNLRIIIILHPLQLLGRQFLAPAAVLLIHHFLDALPDDPKGFRRRQAISASLRYVRFDLLLDPCHPHLEELIQVGIGNAKKLQPFQQRVARIQRLVQHPLVELQPAQLTIEKLGFDAAAHTVIFRSKHSGSPGRPRKVTFPSRGLHSILPQCNLIVTIRKLLAGLKCAKSSFRAISHLTSFCKL